MSNEQQNVAAAAQAEVFKKVDKLYTEYFSHIEKNTQEGKFLVSGERYVMYRAQSMSIFLRNELGKVLGTGVHQAVYRFGRACGSADARFFIDKFQITDPLEKMMTGPIYFAHGGYATVEFLPESAPTTDENCLFVYNHPTSYEAEAFINADIKPDRPICHLNAGYSAGWVSEVLGMQLDAKEIACRAHGAETCTFVLASSRNLGMHIKRIKEIYHIQ